MQVNGENWRKKKIEDILAHKEKHPMFSLMRGLVPNLLFCVFSWEYTWKPGNWKQATGENAFREGRQQNVDEMKVEGRDGEYREWEGSSRQWDDGAGNKDGGRAKQNEENIKKLCGSLQSFTQIQ